MSLYRGLSEEERQLNGTPKYRDFKEARRFLDWDGEGMYYYIDHTEEFG